MAATAAAMPYNDERMIITRKTKREWGKKWERREAKGQRSKNRFVLMKTTKVSPEMEITSFASNQAISRTLPDNRSVLTGTTDKVGLALLKIN